MSQGFHRRDEELELLALGALPEPQAEWVRRHANGCGECAKRLAEARGVAAILAFAPGEETPAAEIRRRLMERITEDKRMEIAGANREKASSRWTRLTWVLIPAALVLGVISLVEWREVQRLNKMQRDSNARLAEADRARTQEERLVRALAAPDTVSYALAATAVDPGAKGLVRYNAKTGLFVCAVELAQIPAEQVYAVWLVTPTGQKLRAGTFTASASAGHYRVWGGEVAPEQEAKGFQISIESREGAAEGGGPVVLAAPGQK